MDKIDQLLQVLENSDFASYEGEEDFSNFTPAQRNKIMQLRQRQPRRTVNDNPNVMQLGNLKGNPANIKAQLDLKVKLTSGTTAMAAGNGYEFALFGANDVSTGYNNLVTDTATRGTGSTVKGGILGSAGAYTSGIYDSVQFALPTATTGNIQITADVVDYPVLLQALITDMFHVNRIRVQSADTTANGLLALGEKLRIIRKSLFGKRDEDVISLSAFKMPEQNQAGIIDVPVNFWVDSNLSIISKIYAVNATASVVQNTLTFSFFIDEYYKHSPKNVNF